MGALLLGLFLLGCARRCCSMRFFRFDRLPRHGRDRADAADHADRMGALLVGSAVGALFAAFAFAISVFAVPMLLEERKTP